MPHSTGKVESASRRPPQPASPCSPDLGARLRVRRFALPSVEVAGSADCGGRGAGGDRQKEFTYTAVHHHPECRRLA